MRLVVAASVLLAVGTAASASPGPGPGPGRVHGVVLVSPAAPVCAAEAACTRPAPGVTLVFSRRGRTVRRVRTGSGGAYTVRLPAGLYAVRVATASPRVQRLSPARARVVAGRSRRIDFLLDLGIQ